MEKKPYQKPELSPFGSLTEITQAFGTAAAGDTIFYANGTIFGPGDGGSQDAIIIPRKAK